LNYNWELHSFCLVLKVKKKMSYTEDLLIPVDEDCLVRTQCAYHSVFLTVAFQNDAVYFWSMDDFLVSWCWSILEGMLVFVHLKSPQPLVDLYDNRGHKQINVVLLHVLFQIVKHNSSISYVGTSHKASGVRSRTDYLAPEQSNATVDWLPSNQPVMQQWTIYLATVT
jgi:hypothetical protein